MTEIVYDLGAAFLTLPPFLILAFIWELSRPPRFNGELIVYHQPWLLWKISLNYILLIFTSHLILALSRSMSGSLFYMAYIVTIILCYQATQACLVIAQSVRYFFWKRNLPEVVAMAQPAMPMAAGVVVQHNNVAWEQTQAG